MNVQRGGATERELSTVSTRAEIKPILRQPTATFQVHDHRVNNLGSIRRASSRRKDIFDLPVSESDREGRATTHEMKSSPSLCGKRKTRDPGVVDIAESHRRRRKKKKKLVAPSSIVLPVRHPNYDLNVVIDAQIQRTGLTPIQT